MGHVSYSSLRIRLLFLVVLAVIPAFALTFYTDQGERQFAAESARAEALRLARLAAVEQEQVLEGARQLLLTLSQVPAVQTADAAGCSSILASVLGQQPRYANIGIATQTGTGLCSATPLSDKGMQQAIAVAARPCPGAKGFYAWRLTDWDTIRSRWSRWPRWISCFCYSIGRSAE